MYLTLIYDKYNNLVQVYERPTQKRAEKAGEFFTKPNGWWYRVTNDKTEIELYKQED